MKYIRSFGLFWWDFIVGDDWRVAVAERRDEPCMGGDALRMAIKPAAGISVA